MKRIYGALWGVLLAATQTVYALNGSDAPRPSLANLHLSMEHRLNLEQAISMALKSRIGQIFKPDIAELAEQGKIRLTALSDKHYGESGEGCIIRDGQYVYEGMFVLLNERQSVPELASSLIHEIDHYRQIKRFNREKPQKAVSIGWLEVSAFARQYEFIQELEKLGLVNHQTMFQQHASAVFDIMETAYRAKTKKDQRAFDAALKKMVAFGYPEKELQRHLLIRSEAVCRGAVEK